MEAIRQIWLSKGQPILSAWRPLPVRVWEPTRPLGNLFLLGVEEVIALDRRAVDALGDLLAQAGELLPLDSQDGEFYAYNPVVMDALDIERSEATWVSGYEGSMASNVTVYSFLPDRIADKSVFRLPQMLGRYYFTDRFRRAADEAGLTGFVFKLIWDSDDPDYHDERYAPEQWERIRREHREERDARSSAAAPEATQPVLDERPLEAGQPEAVRNGVRQMIHAINQAEGLNLTGEETPAALVRAVSLTLDRTRAMSGLGEEQRKTLAISLGALWGEQVCRAYGWHWASLNSKVGTVVASHAVVAPDGSMYVEPLDFIWRHFLDPEQAETTVLLFNMLGDPRKTPTEARPGAYVRVG